MNYLQNPAIMKHQWVEYATNVAGKVDHLSQRVEAAQQVEHHIRTDTQGNPSRVYPFADPKVIVGQAGPQAKASNPIMVMGKSPAADSIATGELYCGPAANVLRKAFKDAGGDLDDHWLTYATPWRPRKENTPSTLQIALSRPLLLREIELVQPRAIIVLGAKANDALFGEHPTMVEDQATPSRHQEIPVVTIRNHGYMLRFPAHYPAWVDRIAKILGDYA